MAEERQKKHFAVQAILHSGKEFLILHRVKNWTGWEFPKGAVEKDEGFEEAMRREIMEETGITEIESIRPLEDRYDFKTGKGIDVTMILFLVSVNKEKIQKIIVDRSEHDDYLWADSKKALSLIRENEKIILTRLIDDKIV